ncbi:MAG TPA: ABC transporter ATP-binding protein [Candidatus Mcinerneyibacteriales bacterium]|nr:ABC transporter ATP-binding protein [Candidatus Mcinerneyibacteriales bacterium]
MRRFAGSFDEKKRKFDIKLVFWLLSYVKEMKLLMGVAVIFLLLGAMLPMALPEVIQRAFDIYIPQGDIHGLFVIAGILLGINAALFFIQYLQVYIMTFLGQRIMYNLRLDIFSHIMRLPKRFFDKNPIGRIMTRVTSDVEALAELLQSGLVLIISESIMLVGILVFLLFKNWVLTLVTLLGTIPLLLLGMTVFRKKITVIYREMRSLVARINAFLQESIVGMDIIQLFNRQKRDMKRFQSLNESYYKTTIRALIINGTFFPFISFLSIFAKAFIIWVGGVQILKMQLTTGQLAAFLIFIEMFFKPLRELSQSYNIFQAAMAASEKITSIMDEPESVVYSVRNGFTGPLDGTIEFRNVWFAYDEENWVLKDVSFKIEKGETVAIVGQTGSGKTTIINLIGRFYDIQKGKILVDGVDIKEWDISALRRKMGIVLQDVFLFSGNVRENISLYNEEISLDEIREIVRFVNADKFIDKLPEKYETLIMERGKALSVGQRQLLSFARTLTYRPAVLILDEATANIDSETEKYIQEATLRMTEGRTAIIIAHRLATIKNAHRIMVIHRGELREAGTHDELIRRKGIYYDLYQLQYKDQESPGA